MSSNKFLKLNRESTRITVAEFYERYQLGKYEFDPDYQRKGSVWSEDKKSFLIDSILKNYPMPPIFLHQQIDGETGATIYNIIDGKQRLSSILQFINDELELPPDYDVGAFGDTRLNSKKFSDLKDDLQEFKMQFWRYVLSVEYIETENLDVINNVFDRLNRNGEPLEAQELRNAKYSKSNLLELVNSLISNVNWEDLGKVKINRMQDAEFVSELVFFLLEKEPLDASTKNTIDLEYEKWHNSLNETKIENVKVLFEKCISFINGCNLDYNKYKINGVSHYYALFGLAFYCIENSIEPEQIKEKLDEFYNILRSQNEDLPSEIQTYKASMQSNTRSKGQRCHRINALRSFCCTQQPF